MKIVPVPGDGDCLYHAFIKGLGIDGLTPIQLREFVGKKLMSDKDLYDDLVTEWIDFGVIKNASDVTPEMAAHHICNTKEWATSTVIHILAVAFNVRIVVFEKINGQFYSEMFPSEWKPKGSKTIPYKDIYLFRRGYHFELLEPIDNIERKDIPTIQNRRLTRRGQRGGGQQLLPNDTLTTMVLGALGIFLFVITI